MSTFTIDCGVCQGSGTDRQQRLLACSACDGNGWHSFDRALPMTLLGNLVIAGALQAMFDRGISSVVYPNNMWVPNVKGKSVLYEEP